jgi:hypothetical protein
MRTERPAKNLGQSALEYAMIISVVAAALSVMNVYVQRSVQANLKLMETKITPKTIANSAATIVYTGP